MIQKLVVLVRKVNEKHTQMHREQHGLVAIFSVMIIMGILTLLVVGFSNSMRQARERTLDDQLSTQAFYAAETGISKALAGLRAGSLTTTNNCSGGFSYDKTIYPALDIEVSCLLANLQPASLEVDFVNVSGEGEPFTIEVVPVGGANVFEFKWDSAPETTDPIPTSGLNGGNPELFSERDWDKKIGVVKVDMVPGNGFARANLVNNMVSFYLYPTTQAVPAVPPVVSAGPLQQGQTILGHCDATPDPDGYRCRAFVSIPSAATGASKLRAQALYNPVKFNMSAKTTLGAVTRFSNGQAIIDSTGRSGDVFKRIQVRVPIVPNANIRLGDHTPFDYISEDTLCKRFIALPGGTTTDTGIPSLPACEPPGGGGAGGNPAGNANFDPNPNTGCGVACNGTNNWKCDILPEVCFHKQFRNISNNSPSVVAGCSWEFQILGVPPNEYGGAPIGLPPDPILSPSDPANGCNKDEVHLHKYPIVAGAAECSLTYLVRMTIYFNNGAQPQTKLDYVYLPNRLEPSNGNMWACRSYLNL